MSSKGKPRNQTAGELIRDIQFGLRELTLRLHHVSEAVGSHVDLQASDLEMLDLLARHGPLSPRQLTATTGIHPATMTGVLDRLERGGWVTRNPDPSDRRKLRIDVLGDRGGELVRLYGPMNRSLAKLCAGYTIGQLEIIRDFLRRASEAGVDAAQTIRATE